ncbi:MAG: leucine-rich repeat domain-containing protein [Eubacterium sp.]|nr:leucine-rich repeat domain-containing protein [Eubacterium sp.]
MKKMSSLILALVIFLNAVFSFSFTSFASGNISRTRIGDSDTYFQYEAATGTLTLSGEGAVPSFSNNSTSIPWYTLRQNREITNVVVLDGITSLGNYCFYQVKASSITLPDSLVSLGQYSLAFSTGITNLSLPFGFTSIGDYAFSNCSAMQSVSFPSTLKTISSYAFQNCSGISSVTIPYDVSVVGSYAFSNCYGLSSVIFQSLTSTVSIGTSAFLGCTSLSGVKLPMKAAIASKAFGYNTSSTKNDNFKIYGFADTNAYFYSQTYDFNFEAIDKIPMQCAALYRGNYNQNNLNDTFCFEFTADMDTLYNFYSRGDVDLKGTIKNSNGETLYENDDIRPYHDLNFSISANLTEGETYYLYVTSSQSRGDFFVVVYPNNIRSITAFGEVEISSDACTEVEGQNVYEITDEMLEDVVVEVNYSNGLTDKVYYTSDYFNRRNFTYFDSQSETPFVCGNNTGYIRLGNATDDINVILTHTYEKSVVYPTFSEQGYTVYTCKYCGDTYNIDYVSPYVTTVSGRVLLAEDKNAAHTTNTPYRHAKLVAQDREYDIAADGTYSVYLSYDGEVEIVNDFGEDYSFNVSTAESLVNNGDTVLEGYDLNADGAVNAKDYAHSIKTYDNTDVETYFSQFAINFYDYTED